jgi:nucleotide-binding universal stress UspA family protein
MYKTILITLDGTKTDRAIVEHVKPLALMMGSQVTLLHVADGWAARLFGPDAVSPEVSEDKAYLESIRAEFTEAGIQAETSLAFGEPAKEIVRWVHQNSCDLVAMSTHGHRFFGDLFLGTTARQVRHSIKTPLLLVRGER